METKMKLLIGIAGGVIYTLACVANYNVTIGTNDCLSDDKKFSKFGAAAGSVLWPVLAGMVGLGSTLFGDPGIYACRAAYSKPRI
jgi:fructose-specific phosphotransferase system IIC component